MRPRKCCSITGQLEKPAPPSQAWRREPVLTSRAARVLAPEKLLLPLNVFDSKIHSETRVRAADELIWDEPEKPKITFKKIKINPTGENKFHRQESLLVIKILFFPSPPSRNSQKQNWMTLAKREAHKACWISIKSTKVNEEARRCQESLRLESAFA